MVIWSVAKLTEHEELLLTEDSWIFFSTKGEAKTYFDQCVGNPDYYSVTLQRHVLAKKSKSELVIRLLNKNGFLEESKVIDQWRQMNPAEIADGKTLLCYPTMAGLEIIRNLKKKD